MDAPLTAGIVSGVSHGVAELPDFARILLKEPGAVAGAVEDFVAEVDTEVLVEMVRGMPADVHRMQHEVNPSDDPPSDDPDEALQACFEEDFLASAGGASDYCRFANGFYAGYGAFLAFELVTGAKAAVKGIRKASEFAKQVRRATDDAGSVTRLITDGGRNIDAQYVRSAAPDGGNPDIDAPRLREELRTRGVHTVSGIRHAMERLDQDVPASVLSRLSSARQADLGRAILRHGDGAVRLARELDPSVLRAVLRADRVGEAIRLTSRTSDGARVLNDLGGSGASDFLAFSAGQADNARVALARAYQEGFLSTSDLRTVANDIATLEGRVAGMDGAITTIGRQYASPGGFAPGHFYAVRGQIYELRLAMKIGPERVEHIGQVIGKTAKADVEFSWQNINSRLSDRGHMVAIEDDLADVPSSAIEGGKLDGGTPTEFAKAQLEDTNSLELDLIESGDGLIYVEAKAGGIDADDILHKYTRLQAYGKMTGQDVEFRVKTRQSPSDAAAAGGGDALEVIDNLDHASIQPQNTDLDLPRN